MLTIQQIQQYEHQGFLVIKNFLAQTFVKELEATIDDIHQEKKGRYKDGLRWDLRNCLPKHPIFLELLTNTIFLRMLVSILGWNIKLLTSQIVKMAPNARSSDMPILFHQDGGTIPAELPEPLPPFMVKIGWCIAGSSQPQAGQLRVVPGSNRLIGPPVMIDGEPYGAIDINLEPGDMIALDYRCWHAVSPNKSNIVRKTLYMGFGLRCLMPIDYDRMPKKLMKISPIMRQLLGGKVTPLGNHLPTPEDVPLRQLDLN